MMTDKAMAEFDRVFGPGSTGSNAEDRARTSSRQFVRSQSQVAEWRDEASGLKMTASQALRVFGYQMLLRVAEEGSAQLIPSRCEPAKTLTDRRSELGLSYRQVAKAAGIPEAVIIQAETCGTITPVRQLMRIAETLALDEQVISYRPAAGGDSELGVRLRTLAAQNGAASHLSANIVLQLAEAAWVTTRQRELERLLGMTPEVQWNENFSSDYHAPVWERGYDLAERAREKLGVGDAEPILNARRVAAKLGLPLVEARIGTRFAGATIANGDHRGIVANSEGANSNVWVRRMTICHELGHLLWDPPSHLGKVKVDTYAELLNPGGDQVETRANAFAISFLAPPTAVLRVLNELSDVTTAAAYLMDKFGIGPGAAKYHLANVYKNHFGRDMPGTINDRKLPRPSDEWQAREEWTNVFFPIASVPESRRGRFAAYVVLAMRRGLISSDTASEWLRTRPETLYAKQDDVLALGELPASVQ